MRKAAMVYPKSEQKISEDVLKRFLKFYRMQTNKKIGKIHCLTKKLETGKASRKVFANSRLMLLGVKYLVVIDNDEESFQDIIEIAEKKKIPVYTYPTYYSRGRKKNEDV